MKKKWIIGIISVFSIFLLGVMGYRGITEYMSDRFAPNTWVDGVYCTGRTVEDVNQELLEKCVAPTVTVTSSKGKSYSLDLKEADYTFDFSKSLEAYQKHQVKNGWLEMAFRENQVSKGKPDVAYDESKVMQWWENLPIVTDEQKKPVYRIYLDASGYHLKNTLEEHLNTEDGWNAVVNAISEGSEQLSLEEQGCYFDYDLNEEQMQIKADYDELVGLEQCGLIYDMGAEKIVFDEALMSSFIAKDIFDEPLRNEDGKFFYDMSLVEDYIINLCEQYHTYGVDRPFLSSKGDIVMVPPGTYGTEIDVNAEKEFLLNYIQDDNLRTTKTVHTPVYLHETEVKGLNDIGGTYVEVDMTEQKIYFYKDNELMVSSDVVTGNLRTRHGTPSGAYFIYGKYKNRILRGPGYASFVRRWMPVVKSIGLHDANWRSEFGGEIYKRDGSHGCVNMPDETTDIIFENAEIGTPVMIYTR